MAVCRLSMLTHEQERVHRYNMNAVLVLMWLSMVSLVLVFLDAYAFYRNLDRDTAWVHWESFIIDFYTCSMSFFHFGPSTKVFFMLTPCATWWFWSIRMVVLIAVQTIKVLSDDLICPWITNVLQDPKSSDLENVSRGSVLHLMVVKTAFDCLQQLFIYNAMLYQIDFLVAAVLISCCQRFFTTVYYLDFKVPLPAPPNYPPAQGGPVAPPQKQVVNYGACAPPPKDSGSVSSETSACKV